MRLIMKKGDGKMDVRQWIYENIIVGVLTIGLVGVYAYLVITGGTVPDDLVQLVFIIVSFFFGSEFQKRSQ